MEGGVRVILSLSCLIVLALVIPLFIRSSGQLFLLSRSLSSCSLFFVVICIHDCAYSAGQIIGNDVLYARSQTILLRKTF